MTAPLRTLADCPELMAAGCRSCPFCCCCCGWTALGTGFSWPFSWARSLSACTFFAGATVGNLGSADTGRGVRSLSLMSMWWCALSAGRVSLLITDRAYVEWELKRRVGGAEVREEEADPRRACKCECLSSASSVTIGAGMGCMPVPGVIAKPTKRVMVVSG